MWIEAFSLWISHVCVWLELMHLWVSAASHSIGASSQEQGNELGNMQYAYAHATEIRKPLYRAIDSFANELYAVM